MVLLRYSPYDLLCIHGWVFCRTRNAHIWCDNNVVVNAFTYHKTKHNFLMARGRSV